MLIYLFEDHFTVKVFTAIRRLKGGSEVSQKPFRTCSFEDMKIRVIGLGKKIKKIDSKIYQC